MSTKIQYKNHIKTHLLKIVPTLIKKIHDMYPKQSKSGRPHPQGENKNFQKPCYTWRCAETKVCWPCWVEKVVKGEELLPPTALSTLGTAPGAQIPAGLQCWARDCKCAKPLVILLGRSVEDIPCEVKQINCKLQELFCPCHGKANTGLNRK